MARYRLSERAAEDLQEIANYNYIRQNRATAVPGVLAGIRRVFRQLAKNLQMGTLCEYGRPNLRMIVPDKPSRRYVVFFRYDEMAEFVDILSIIDAARDCESLLVDRDL